MTESLALPLTAAVGFGAGTGVKRVLSGVGAPDDGVAVVPPPLQAETNSSALASVEQPTAVTTPAKRRGGIELIIVQGLVLR